MLRLRGGFGFFASTAMMSSPWRNFSSVLLNEALIGLAFPEKRILLTEDKDFGWLVFAARMHSPGVVLLRFPAQEKCDRPVGIEDGE
jgi:hypothetical protein